MKRSGWKNGPDNFRPVFYKRNIDTFILFKDKSHAPVFLNYLNSQYRNINFTMETEQNSELPFLDTLVRRMPNILSTFVNRMPTFSGFGLSISVTPLLFSYKINSIETLISRALIICFNYILFHVELQFLQTYLLLCFNRVHTPQHFWPWPEAHLTIKPVTSVTTLLKANPWRKKKENV